MNRFLKERLEELLEDVEKLERENLTLKADNQRLELQLDLERERCGRLQEEADDLTERVERLEDRVRLDSKRNPFCD